MTKIVPISRHQHAKKRWKRFSNYSFAAKDAIAPLAAQELPRASMSLSIGFVEAADGFQLVALQGIRAGQNLWVTPAGRWIGPYIPAAYRSYPFVLGNASEGRRVLCVHDDEAMISDTQGELFFDKEGELAKPVQEVMRFLEQLTQSARHTASLVAMLADNKLIKPWNIQIKAEDGEQTIQGVFCIDEAAFNTLPGDAVVALHKAGALPLVYCQLLSMQNLHVLGQLANRHHEVATAGAAPQGPAGDIDLEFLKDGDIIRFQ